MEKIVKGAEGMRAFAAECVGFLKEKRTGYARLATLVGLSGELGSGKTTFVQGAADALGVRETVASPTFVIEKVYLLPDGPWKRLIHIDAYRLDGGRELAQLGWDDISRDPENIIFLEWPERVADLSPHTHFTLRFEFVDDVTRRVYVEEAQPQPPESW